MAVVSAAVGQQSQPAIIPLPVSVQPSGEWFYIKPTTKIVCATTTAQPVAHLLQTYITGISLQHTTVEPAADYILLKLDSATIAQPEGYRLVVNNNNIQLTAHDAGGLVYGVQTLRQLCGTVKNNAIPVAGGVINDYPRFAYRGMALDVCRHMFPVSFIKKYIDVLSLYKFNTFHWHLTDDQGWRIEIKKYPKLQAVAAWRSETLIGHKKELPHHFDGKRYGGYYTQQQIKELVQYAASRHITIIPEIEMPGHAQAALAAYPALGCTGGPYATATFWGVFDDVYCAGNDSTFAFLQNVLDEVMDLFPSRYIHIGGDECPKTRWKACPKCQQRISTLGLKDEHALQSYFIQRIEKYVNSRGRNIIGWDEILEGGLAPNATVMSWRGEEGGKAAMAQQHPVVMTPEGWCYFDYYQSLYNQEPVAAGGYTPLKKVYTYEPASNGLDASYKYLAGVEGQAWSEYYTNEAKAEYMIFPRALALAEVAWTPTLLRNYDDFLHRLRNQQTVLQHIGLNYNRYFDDITCAIAQPKKQAVTLTLQSTLPGAEIRYTTNNSVPTMHSMLYAGALTITKTATVKAMLFKHGQPAGRLFQQYVRMHKAIGAQVQLVNKPVERFNTSADALVNGVLGNNRYNDGQWAGFSGNDLEAVVDLGKEQTIQRVGLNVLNYHWQRMWAPVTLNILASADGEHFTEVYTQHNFPVNGINTIAAAIKPIKARYIKVMGKNKGVIPAGEYGAGGNALLLIDEIIID